MTATATTRNSHLLENMDSLGREYVTFIEFIKNQYPLDEISRTEEFKNFRSTHLISFKDASLVDLYFFGYCGGYWISAYMDYINDNIDKFKCDIVIISETKELLNIFDPNYHLLVTYGEDETKYYSDVQTVFLPRFYRRWIHKKDITDIDTFNYSVSYCYIDNVLRNHIFNYFL